jgi:zinc transporter ZupT
VSERASIDAQAKEVSHCESCADSGIDDADDIGAVRGNISSAVEIAMELPNTLKVNWSLAGSVLVGDMLHNFGDGLFIGAAFLSCSWATAWSITAATIYHEMAQEVSDFIVLTHIAGLSNTKAFVLNFISGLSVVLGGIVILAGEPTDEAVGVVLAMAAGVYIYIAACETVPRMETAVKTRGDRVLVVFAIILGTIPLGLVLLDHKHCG